MRVSNFLFHRVSPERDPFWDPMDPALFENVIRYISERFHVVLLEELVRDPGRYDVSATPICTIGFDDGYRDNLTEAAPVLERYGCPASFYVVTDCVDGDRPTWTYELDHLLRATSMTPDDAEATKARLKALSHEERSRELAALRESYAVSDVPKGLMMSWDDVRTLVRKGFTVGSHSKTHSMLGTMADRAQIRHELETSRDVIARETGVAPLAISYPIGSFSDTVVEEARGSGYQLGLATGQRSFELTNGFDPFRIPRLELYNESWLKTKLRIDGVIERVKRWLAR